MHIDINHLIHLYGYMGVFFVLLIEVLGIPFPAETTLTLAGIAWTRGSLSLLPILCFAAFGNVTGSTIAYTIGRWLGQPITVRYGKIVGLTSERFAAAEQKFNKYRVPVVVFAKFIAGIRVIVPYLAGINRMPFWSFTIFNAISAFVWSALFIILGKYIGMAWHKYHHFIHHYLFQGIGIAVVLVVMFYLMKKRRADVANKDSV